MRHPQDLNKKNRHPQDLKKNKAQKKNYLAPVPLAPPPPQGLLRWRNQQDILISKIFFFNDINLYIITNVYKKNFLRGARYLYNHN